MVTADRKMDGRLITHGRLAGALHPRERAHQSRTPGGWVGVYMKTEEETERSGELLEIFVSVLTQFLRLSGNSYDARRHTGLGQ